MRKENKYAIAFDANKNFREIRIMDDPNEPFTIGKDMAGGSIYVFTQKEFKKLIESAMRHLTNPVGVDHSENIDGQAMATGDVGRVKGDNGGSVRGKPLEEAKGAFKSANVTYGDGRAEGVLTGVNPMQFSLSGLDKCVTAGDGGIYYIGDLFDKGSGKGNGKQ